MITIHAFGMVLMLSLLIPGLNVELQNPPTAAATSPNTMPSFILNPPGAADLRRLFERLGATYIKLGQVCCHAGKYDGFSSDFYRKQVFGSLCHLDKVVIFRILTRHKMWILVCSS
jgi:hypothetical protein